MFLLTTLLSVVSARSLVNVEQQLLEQLERMTAIQSQSMELLSRLGLNEAPDVSLEPEKRDEYLRLFANHSGSDVWMKERDIVLIAEKYDGLYKISMAPFRNLSQSEITLLDVRVLNGRVDSSIFFDDVRVAAENRVDFAFVTMDNIDLLPSILPISARIREQKVKRQSRATAQREYIGAGERCHMLTVYFEFNTSGWDKWVLSPDGFHLSVCRGTCPVRHHQLARMKHLPSEEKGCCTATKRESLEIVYAAGENDFRKKILKDFIVSDCGCSF